MGYRSDVAIVMDKEKYAEALLTNELPTFLGKDLQPQITEVGVFWYIEETKWYSGYRFIDDTMNFLEPLFVEGLAGFIRAGEDHGDIEVKGNPEKYDMHVNIDIDMPPGFEW